MACILPNMNAEKEALLSEAIVHAQQQNEKTILELKTKIQKYTKEYSCLTSNRWHLRKKIDLETLLQKLQSQIDTLTISKSTLRNKFEKIEIKYANALQIATKLKGHRLVSSSIHSSSRNFRKANIVLMSNENAGECIRQHLRCELGLQDTPLMLTPGDVCDDCGIQMTVVSNDSMLSCPQCHKLRLLPNSMTTSALHGTDSESSTSITKHRLPEWIEMAQGKEFSEPPDDIITSVSEFLVLNKMTGIEEFASIIKEERKRNGPFKGVQDALQRLNDKIPDISSRLLSINSSSIRTALRGLVTTGKGEQFRKYYERSSKISALVSGYWPPRMTGQQEEMLRLLYTVAAPEYEKRRKPKQTYWPGGFPFFLRCVCILLGWDEFAMQFPIPSGSKEGGNRDLLRNEIWSELGWEIVNYSGHSSPIELPDGTFFSISLEDSATEEIQDGEDPETIKNTKYRKVAKYIQKEVETKINIKKRRRVDFELECS